MYTCILANLQYTYMICIQKMTMYACIHLIYHDSMSRLAEKFFHLWENWAQVGPYDGAHLPFGNPKNPLVIVEFAMSRRRQIPHNMYMCRYIMVYICHYLCICVYLNIYIYTIHIYIHMILSPYGSHQVVQVAFGIINAALAQETNNGVLVHCWGGVNRSAACVVAFLTTQCLGDAGNVGTGWGWRTTWVCRKVRGTQRKIHGHFFEWERCWPEGFGVSYFPNRLVYWTLW